eukprot:2018967-Pyramimonas_sp.AAC.1
MAELQKGLWQKQAGSPPGTRQAQVCPTVATTRPRGQAQPAAPAPVKLAPALAASPAEAPGDSLT